MSEATTLDTIDVIRWTFTTDPDQGPEIEAYLTDLGPDVYVKDQSRFTVIWEEPDLDLDAVVESLWNMNGESFEITYEEFHRVNHLVYPVDEEATDDPDNGHD